MRHFLHSFSWQGGPHNLRLMKKKSRKSLLFMLAGSALFAGGLLLWLLNEIFPHLKILCAPWGEASPISNWIYTMLTLSGFPVRPQLRTALLDLRGTHVAPHRLSSLAPPSCVCFPAPLIRSLRSRCGQPTKSKSWPWPTRGYARASCWESSFVA